MENGEKSSSYDSIEIDEIDEIVSLDELYQWLGDSLEDEYMTEVESVVSHIYQSLLEPVESLNTYLYWGHDKDSDSIQFHIKVIRIAAKQAIEMLKLSGPHAYSHRPWYECLCIGIPDIVQSGEVFMWKIFKAADNLSKSPVMASLALNIKTIEDAGGKFESDIPSKGGKANAKKHHDARHFLRTKYQVNCRDSFPELHGGFSSKNEWVKSIGREALARAGYKVVGDVTLVRYLAGLPVENG